MSQMETDESGGGSVSEVIQEVKTILWGNQIREELFLRWSQGIY